MASGTSGDSLAGRDLIGLLDLDSEEVSRILELGRDVKGSRERFAGALRGKTLFMYFEKPSLRTRVTFEAGMTQLGGHAIYYTASDGKIGVRESVADVGRNLERWVDAAMCRTFRHELIQELADSTAIPVINGLTDLLHPCQALADYLTLLEVKGTVRGIHLAYVGDGNNVAHSLLAGGARLGTHVTVVTPPGYEPDAAVVRACREAASATSARIRVSHDLDAIDGADAVYTDVWASMGQEEEAAERMKVFASYQVNAALMSRAAKDAVFLHCLPAHRGDEVTDEVADSDASVIFRQAENRLHAQKAVLLLLLGAA